MRAAVSLRRVERAVCWLLQWMNGTFGRTQISNVGVKWALNMGFVVTFNRAISWSLIQSSTAKTCGKTAEGRCTVDGRTKK